MSLSMTRNSLNLTAIMVDSSALILHINGNDEKSLFALPQVVCKRLYDKRIMAVISSAGNSMLKKEPCA